MKSSRKKIEKQSTPAYGIYPQGAPNKDMGSYLSQGKWVSTDPKRDKEIKDYTDFVKKNPFGATPTITVEPETYIKYAQKKKMKWTEKIFLGWHLF